MKKYLLSLILLVTSLYAEITGSASILIFFNDTPLQHNEVRVDGEYSDYTDEDGVVMLVLEVGKHQIEVFAKDENGVNIGYVKKQITIKESKDTQVIATFEGQGFEPLVDIDTPIVTTSQQAITKFATLNGIIFSSETNKPISNARVFVKGTSTEARTDKDGKFTIQIPAETNASISVIHSEYASQTLENLSVKENASITKKVLLTPASMELEEFVVLAPKVQGSIASLIQEVKSSNSITNVIGSEQMSKQGDSNAAAALKRVAGVTIMGGKYIYVRGLGDRYSATELNNMSLPSPNPIKRTVPLDMFPSGVIGSLQVQKTASADITSAFGGGYVNIRTKNKFNEDHAKLKLGIEMHSSYGDEVKSSQSGGSDWIGSDDGYRAFDQAFQSSITPTVGQTEPEMTQSRTEMQEIISQRSYNHKLTNVPLGQSANIEFAKKFELDDEQTLYLLGTYGYKNTHKNLKYTDYDYVIASDGTQQDDPLNVATTQRYVTNIQHGGLLNLGYTFRGLELQLSKLYVLNTLDQTRFAEGTFGENQSDEQQTFMEWQERELDTNQLSGKINYKVYLENEFHFGYEYATASEYVPNDIYYNYKKSTIAGSDYEFMRNQSQMTFLHRTTDDKVKNFYLTNKTIIPMLSDEDSLEIGYTDEGKTRESRVTRFEMKSRLRDQNITTSPIDNIVNYNDPESVLRFSLLSLPKESYDASLDRDALFAKLALKPLNEADLIIGLRHVNVNETIDQFATDNNDVVITEENSLKFSKNLPSVAFKYAFDKSNQIKLAYTETFIYPDFREFSDTEFIHPVFIAKIAGNPDLIETDIQSYDLQYGYYFNDLDNITTSLFYKHMDNPIEDVRTFTSSTLDRFSFENSSEAELYGVEFSWYKKLDFIDEALKNFSFFGNYTHIESKVTLTPEQKAKFVTSDRGLQGLSPDVINFSFLYQDKKRSLNLAYNKMSQRLMRVALKNGDVILGLDDYEEPPHILDFTWIEKFRWSAIKTDLDMTFKIKNILDGETTWIQGDKTTLKYKTGREYSFSISAKI